MSLYAYPQFNLIYVVAKVHNNADELVVSTELNIGHIRPCHIVQRYSFREITLWLCCNIPDIVGEGQPYYSKRKVACKHDRIELYYLCIEERCSEAWPLHVACMGAFYCYLIWVVKASYTMMEMCHSETINCYFYPYRNLILSIPLSDRIIYKRIIKNKQIHG